MNERARGTVAGIFLRDGHGKTPRPVSQANAVLQHGLAGDFNGKRPEEGWRQVLLVDRGDLESLGLKPGDLREQITVDLPGLMLLPGGARLEAGDVVLEITRDCEPCTRIGPLIGRKDAEAFRRTLIGRRGMFARVAEVRGAARIAVGDAVRVLAPAPGSAARPTA